MTFENDQKVEGCKKNFILSIMLNLEPYIGNCLNIMRFQWIRKWSSGTCPNMVMKLGTSFWSFLEKSQFVSPSFEGVVIRMPRNMI